MTYLLASRQEWALALATMLWGATFLLIRWAMQACGPMYFVGLRFGFAAILLLLLSGKTLRGLTWREGLGGALLGVIIYLGFGLQTLGLVSIPAAKSAFITAFYVPLVPLLEVVFLKHKLGRSMALGLSIAFPGVLLVAWPEGQFTGFGMGEMVTLFCALVFAVEIVVLAILAPNCNTRRMVTVEVIITSLLGFASMPLFGESFVALPSWAILIVLVLGFLTACIQNLLTWAQKTVPPSRATLIYTAEPVWAGFFGFLAGERLGLLALLGCGLIVLGILVSNQKTH